MSYFDGWNNYVHIDEMVNDNIVAFFPEEYEDKTPARESVAPDRDWLDRHTNSSAYWNDIL